LFWNLLAIADALSRTFVILIRLETLGMVADTTARVRSEFFETFDSLNPATGVVVGTFPVMGQVEVERVVAEARAAAEWWASRTYGQRERHLLAWAAYIAAHSDDLAELLHAEHGKPVGDAHVLEIVPALEQIRWAAKNAKSVLKSRRVKTTLLTANYAASVEYGPYGCCAVIGPWNYPVFTTAGSMAYALAAGNTVVLKPSEYTPATGEFLVNAFIEANPDAPTGVLSLVSGDGRTGAYLCVSGVDKVAFTGSPATARKVMAACATNLTPVLLECGGKDPMIVAADADVAAAAKEAVWGGMTNAGQTCVGIERVYVANEIADQFLDRVRAELKGVKAGSDKGALLGPMTMPGQIDVVRRHVDDAIKRGVEFVVGGAESFRGSYIDPIVMSGLDESAEAVQEETFGPTLTIRRFGSIDEAIRLANGTQYALGASVFSRGQGMEIARQLRAGMVSINSALSFVGIPSIPFGGRGESGFGRNHGAEGLKEYATTKSYSKLKYALPGSDVSTLHRKASTTRMVRMVAKLRHR